MRAKLLLAALFFLSTPVMADPVPYASPDCGFTVKLPATPITSRQCEGQNCNMISRSVMNFEDGSRLDAKVSCNRLSASAYDAYSADIMKSLLFTRAQKNNIFDPQIEAQTFKNTKQAVLLSRAPTQTYMSQLWASPKSLFSVETTVTGEETSEAFTSLVTLMQSIQPIDTRPVAEQQGEAGPKPQEAAPEPSPSQP